MKSLVVQPTLDSLPMKKARQFASNEMKTRSASKGRLPGRPHWSNPYDPGNPTRMVWPLACALALAVLGILWVHAAIALSPEATAMNQPVRPFQVAGDLYYVGASDVASYLVVTPDGLIVIDGGFPETAVQIEANIATLGYKLENVKLILNGHAHPDHAGGVAKLKRDSGASFAAMAEEVVPLENAGRGTFYRGDRELFESIHVDRVLHDGDHVELGGVTLTAHLTPGHTPGCTTWTFPVQQDATVYNVVVTCQMTVPSGIAISGDPAYPTMVQDFGRSFSTLRSLRCDIFLSEHGSAFSLTQKRARAASRHTSNPFVDPNEFKRYLDDAEGALRIAVAAGSMQH
jgi:metallo-beta-lactamase class B